MIQITSGTNDVNGLTGVKKNVGPRWNLEEL